MFYEHDFHFRDFVSVPQNYMGELKKVQIISTPDCSLYRDMPLWAQIANIGVNRSIGYYLQEQGKYVIPNVRWGDERTYSRKYFDSAPAFAGVPKNSIVSIGTYGCSRTREDKYYLEAGLDSMLSELNPQVVIVYGSYNPRIFEKYERYTHFHHPPGLGLVSNFALVHSNEGAFTRSQTRENGKMVIKLRLNNGGHGQKRIRVT